MKKFLSSYKIKKVGIFLGTVVSVMGLTALISLLPGCAVSNYYTKVDEVSLIHRSTGRQGNFEVVYMVVANPTSDRKHYVVRCCSPRSTTECLPDVNVVVHPRSDENVSVHTLSSVVCHLLPANLLD